MIKNEKKDNKLIKSVILYAKSYEFMWLFFVFLVFDTFLKLFGEADSP